MKIKKNNLYILEVYLQWIYKGLHKLIPPQLLIIATVNFPVFFLIVYVCVHHICCVVRGGSSGGHVNCSQGIYHGCMAEYSRMFRKTGPFAKAHNCGLSSHLNKNGHIYSYIGEITLSLAADSRSCIYIWRAMILLSFC